MRKSARKFFARQRDLRRAANVQRDARKAVVLDGPHSAKEYLLALGLDKETADRFTSAFSKGVPAARITWHDKKLTGKRHGSRIIRVEVKLYDWNVFAARLLTYRPKNADAAARFADLATLVAA